MFKSFCLFVQVCNKILNVTPNDPLAFHCKIVSMVHCGKFEDALKQMENDKFQLDLTFERAYCFYRMNNPLKALEIVDSVKMPKVGYIVSDTYVVEKLNSCFSWYSVFAAILTAIPRETIPDTICGLIQYWSGPSEYLG